MHYRPHALLLSILLLATTALAQEAQSTFGHARARQLATAGQLPTERDIVVRDLVNYHRHRLPLPQPGQAVALDVRFDRDAAGPGDELWLQIGYATAGEGDRTLAPPCAVALVVDCSGSMQERGKMQQVQLGLQAFVQQLRPGDQVALIAFAGEAKLIAAMRRRDDGNWLAAAIQQLTPGGSTNLHAGAMLGLDALHHGDLGDLTRRMIVLTDGIANTGVIDPAQIASAIAECAANDVDVSTIGVGRDLDTALLQQLARQSRGLFHFVADAQDVQKVFVAEADSLLVPVARHLELTLALPSELVAEQVYDESLVATERLLLQLPDLNAGATGVVLVRCRMRSDVALGGAPLVANATLRYTRPGPQSHAAKAQHVDHAATLRGGSPAAHDLEVRRNAAIALLADGLARMARAADQRRWSDAAAALQRATEHAERLCPGTDDDLQRVRDIANGYRETLRRYVDRFRDL